MPPTAGNGPTTRLRSQQAATRSDRGIASPTSPRGSRRRSGGGGSASATSSAAKRRVHPLDAGATSSSSSPREGWSRWQTASTPDRSGGKATPLSPLGTPIAEHSHVRDPSPPPLPWTAWGVVERVTVPVVNLLGEALVIITLAVIIPVVRWYLDNFAMWYRRVWYYHGAHLCLDGHCPTVGVDLRLGVAYGDGPDETMDVVTPEGAFAKPPSGWVGDEKGPVAVYLHGGGFVACTSLCLLHSVPIPLARNGYRVYSINYPLAPENSYPDPVIAALRALAAIRRETGATSVVLMGDSAGGAVAATVAALVTSAGLYEQLAAEAEARPGGADWRVLPARSDLPGVSRLVSIYGVMDWRGWSDNRDPLTGERPAMRWNDHIGASVLSFCLRCYNPDRLALGGRCLLSDFDDGDLAAFPDTLLLCGSWDPLIHGNRECAERLKRLGRSVRLEEFPAHHAFLGAPISWNILRWTQDTWPAFCAMTRWLHGRDPRTPDGWPTSQWLDPTLPFAVAIALTILPVVMVVAVAGRARQGAGWLLSRAGKGA